MLRRKIGQQLGQPTKSVAGWLVTKFLKWHNVILEENAVKRCQIQPDETVLELGHGPGFGLQAAVKLLTGSKGKLLGVDYSEYMHQMATKRMSDHIASGKVTLHLGNITAMPITDSSVDKVYHCNCYYYWPDLKAGATEIHRVMKPGGLMITTLRLDNVAIFANKKILSGENWRPEAYMDVLQFAGFTDVRMTTSRDKMIKIETIYATATK
ncbi:uncharacterized methyltransferase YdaC [Trichomycterus rosablanca]|uniref:uncharacterized methyltransferase YdaC n=1 Tax=Trichomycterus rosablanca TaxID=2290929 RepID=UPI002F35F301